MMASDYYIQEIIAYQKMIGLLAIYSKIHSPGGFFQTCVAIYCIEVILKMLKTCLFSTIFFQSWFQSLDALYFDSTFCRKGAENIPALKLSHALCVKMVKDWLEKDSNTNVLIWCGE